MALHNEEAPNPPIVGKCVEVRDAIRADFTQGKTKRRKVVIDGRTIVEERAVPMVTLFVRAFGPRRARFKRNDAENGIRNVGNLNSRNGLFAIIRERRILEIGDVRVRTAAREKCRENRTCGNAKRESIEIRFNM